MVQGSWYRWLLGLTLCAVVLTPPTPGRCFGPPRESSGMIPFIDTQALRDYATYLRDPTEGGEAGGHRDAPAGHDDARSEALVETAGRRRQERAGDVVHRDRCRHGRGRPSVQPLERRDVDGEPVEPETETAERHDERRAHDVPAVEVSSAHARA